MMAQDALYHAKCLASLYKKAAKATLSDVKDSAEKRVHGIVLAELLAFIEDIRTESRDVPPVFKLADLAKMYESRLKQLGVNIVGRLRSTTLKNRILAHFEDMKAYREGRDLYLAFDEDIGLALKIASKADYDDEAVILSQAANILRKDIFGMERSKFTGTFEKDCQQSSVPQSLSSFVGMLMGGANIETQGGNVMEAQAALTISQLLMYNCTVRRRKGSAALYHSKEREPPLPIYVGLLLHAETRKRGLVDKLYDLGMSISYDRVLSISTDMGNSVSDLFEEEQIVCPPKLRSGIFTTSAVDNIDHNPSSTTAQGSFHGTGISLFQHPSVEFEGVDRGIIILNPDDPYRRTKLSGLPEIYTIVPPVMLREKEPTVPNAEGPFLSECEMTPLAFNKHKRYLFKKNILINAYPC